MIIPYRLSIGKKLHNAHATPSMDVKMTIQDFRKLGVLRQKLHENERITDLKPFSVTGIPDISGTLTSMPRVLMLNSNFAKGYLKTKCQ